MIRAMRFLVILPLFAPVFLGQIRTPQPGPFRDRAAQAGTAIRIMDRNGKSTQEITDGNRISLWLEGLDNLSAGSLIEFRLEGVDQPVASCQVHSGDQTCQSESFNAIGWRWDAGGNPLSRRNLMAFASDGRELASTSLQVLPRPVVMVHGFSSDYTAWNNYLGDQGYLAGLGVPGFAVGDGQVPGVMNTGQLTNPLGRTNTIAQNAAILRAYIDAVKQKTGAEMVDLLAHSMGGMISRYTIDRLMPARDIAQLIMLGSPQLGTACANLPASLGYYLPATLEIQPEYALKVFNPQIYHRHGVPFSILAGDPIANPAGSPCTGVPSDLVISRQSATGLPLDAKELPILHVELNTSAEAFDGFVKPMLQKGPGEFPEQPDPVVVSPNADPIQFGQVFHGHLESGQTTEISIPIETGIQVASFGLYDPSQSLQVEVHGASGNVIELSTEKNSLIEVDDPHSMIYLGYGFNQPKPGVWMVKLLTTDRTPTTGTDYALTARFTGGANLSVNASLVLPQPGETVHFQASLALNGQAIAIQQATGRLTDADHQSEPITMQPDGQGYQADWQAERPGLVSADFLVTGVSPDGVEIQRSANLILEVQPQTNTNRPRILLVLLAGSALLLLLLILWTGRLILNRIVRHKSNP